MMKKAFAISLIGIYLTLSVIDVIRLHFCHDNLISIALTYHSEDCCSGLEANSCSHCKDVVIPIDFDTDHLISSNIPIPPLYALVSRNLALQQKINLILDSNFRSFISQEIALPPPDLYLRQGALLFYG